MRATWHHHRVCGLAAALAVAGVAAAQPEMYAFQFNGDVLRVDAMTGAATLVGNNGFGANAGAGDASGRLFTMNSATQLILNDPLTGAGSLFLTVTGAPIGTGPRGMDFHPLTGDLYVAFSPAATTVPDTLGRINMSTGAVTVVGSMIRPDIQGLAFDGSGNLFALGVFGGVLYRVDSGTGAATAIGGSGITPDDQALEFAPDGTLYSARENLKRIDPLTGAATLIGPTGFTDIRGLAALGEACYADCDTSTGPGVLDIFDFLCFQNRYAAGAPYACECDTSTGPGVCDIFDFLCFQNAFAAGCP